MALPKKSSSGLTERRENFFYISQVTFWARPRNVTVEVGVLSPCDGMLQLAGSVHNIQGLSRKCF
jgi:hypothetical protein